MIEPTITCPGCKIEFKLTESLAGPLLESTRKEFERQLSQKDSDIRVREQAVREKEHAVEKSLHSIEEELALRLKAERGIIIEEEARKARNAILPDLEKKDRAISELNDVLRDRTERLTEAQDAQVELLRKQRELDDAIREMDLRIETRVQDSLATVRQEARKEAETQLTPQMREKESTIASLQEQLSEFKRRDDELRQREDHLRGQQEGLAKERQSIDEQIALKLNEERTGIAVEEAKKARLTVSTDLAQKTQEISELQEALKQREERLAEARGVQVELMRKQRELDEEKRELELTIEKRIQESILPIQDKARREAGEELKLKVLEKETIITSMQRQIEELKRRAEQGSQQLQGEVQELELEAMLRLEFPRDTIVAIQKGEHGGDVLQLVFGPAGQECGKILWESKRTKNWSDAWLAKLRDDMRASGAETAMLVSQVLPRGMETFDLIDGVWVTAHRLAMPVGRALRIALIELALARKAREGQQTKMELVYQYLTGHKFRHRIQAIVENFSDMQEDLNKERRVMNRQWAKREAQIRGVIDSTAGMYGDLQGIAGKHLEEIEGLDVQLLPQSEVLIENSPDADPKEEKSE